MKSCGRKREKESSTSIKGGLLGIGRTKLSTSRNKEKNLLGRRTANLRKTSQDSRDEKLQYQMAQRSGSGELSSGFAVSLLKE